MNHLQISNFDDVTQQLNQRKTLPCVESVVEVRQMDKTSGIQGDQN